MSKNPKATDVKDKVKKLEDEEKAVDDLWAARQKQLHDAYNLQVGVMSAHTRAVQKVSDGAIQKKKKKN